MAVESAVATPEAAAAKPAGKSKLMLIGGAVVLLTAGAGGAYWWKGRQAASATGAQHEEVVSPGHRGLVSFEPFVANLADEGGRRFVRATVQLVVANPDAAKEMEEAPVLVMQARSIILELLTTQRADDSVTPEGKAALRKAIVAQVTEALHDVEVVDVLFSDFVVQF